LRLLVRQRWAMLITFLLVMGIGMAWTLTRPRLYRATAELLVTPMERGASSDSIAQSIGVLTRVRSVATEMKMLRNPDLLHDSFAALPVEQRAAGFLTREASLRRYPVVVSNPKDTDIINVEVTARDPKAAASLANLILATNTKRHQETTRSIAEMATQHVNAELQKCDTELRSVWGELTAYKKAHNIVDLSTQTAAEAQGLANLEAQVTQAQVEAVQAKLTRQTLERELGRTSEIIEASRTAVDSPVIQTIDAEIERLEQQRASLLQEYLPTAPEVRAIDQQIASARQRKTNVIHEKTETVTHSRNPLRDSLRQSYISALVAEQEAHSRVRITQGHAGTVRGRLASLPDSEQRIALLYSRIEELRSTRAYLANEQQSLKLTMHGGLPNVMPITQATPTFTPVSPNVPASIVLLVALASLLALGVAVVRDQLDDHLHSIGEVEQLAGHRVLTALPPVQNGFRGLVSEDECPAALLESFRILRGKILLSMLEPLPRVIMITSPQAGDGKSTTVANLAATIAMSGKSVLVIDGDLRHPSMHFHYGLANAVGLSSILQGDATLHDALQATPVERLSLISSGPTPKYPPETLASPALARLLDDAREAYDCILLDSTPLVNLSDGAVLASLAEGIIMVVSSDRTRQADLQYALQVLETTGKPVLGIVYNRSEEMHALRWRAEESL
jgi:capsular exopolysaccharide synthesis family protein